MCSTYSSNQAEHISEIIFQFRVVVWPCHMNLFHIDFDKKTTKMASDSFDAKRGAIRFGGTCMAVIQN